MKRLSYLLILLLCYACQSDDEPTPAPTPLSWETTAARIDGRFNTSKRIAEDQLLIYQDDRLLTLDSTLEINTLFEFEVDHFNDPEPVLTDRFFVVSEVLLRSDQGLPDSIGYHIYPLDNPANKYVLNIREIRDEIASSTSQVYDVDIAAINSNDRILFSFTNYDQQKYVVVLYDIVYNGGPITLENKLVVELSDLSIQDYKSVTSWEEYFYISSYDAVYQMDGMGTISKIADESKDGAIFEFNGRLHMGTNGITADWFSEDDGQTWNKTEQYDYFSLFPLGTVNNKLVYSRGHSVGVFLTDDLINAEQLEVSNGELDIKHLPMMGNYLYGINNGLVMRLDLSDQ